MQTLEVLYSMESAPAWRLRLAMKRHPHLRGRHRITHRRGARVQRSHGRAGATARARATPRAYRLELVTLHRDRTSSRIAHRRISMPVLVVLVAASS